MIEQRSKADTSGARSPAPVEPLFREVTGKVLRRHRHDRAERLVETARRAGVSSQYLSELERGRKDASSELLGAVAGALGLSLLDLTREVAVELARSTSIPVLGSVPARDGDRSIARPQNASRSPLALAA
ncbi:helix-turn-helix domain-containing protein [Gordonia polyisoprenivorans]|uniref:helix-turn-helix domain-containing protein n=1 Tax=Gordonia polyisoprenivorans TaxID=84595 RepID=UPI001AD75C8A|nr:helix-turn-helix transcriptional regulator [Gordonia polyisoprenivorans]QTI71070.1 helix-turn-helix transcriptional regulator [Gordonia polyisoprenivorans]